MSGLRLGRNFLLQVNTQSNYVTVMGLQTTGLSIGNTVVPITSTKSAGWREILGDCGNQTMSLTGTGVFKNDLGQQAVEQWAFSHALRSCRVIFEESGENFSGLFMVSKLEYNGTYNGAVMYNITLESSGTMYGPDWSGSA